MKSVTELEDQEIHRLYQQYEAAISAGEDCSQREARVAARWIHKAVVGLPLGIGVIAGILRGIRSTCRLIAALLIVLICIELLK